MNEKDNTAKRFSTGGLTASTSLHKVSVLIFILELTIRRVFMIKKIMLCLSLVIMLSLTSGCMNRIRQIYQGPERNINELALISTLSGTYGGYFVLITQIDDVQISFFRPDTYATVLPGTHTIKMRLILVNSGMGVFVKVNEITLTRNFIAGETYDWIVGVNSRSEDSDHYLWLDSWPLKPTYPPGIEVIFLTKPKPEPRVANENIKVLLTYEKTRLDSSVINDLTIFHLRTDHYALPKHLR